MQNCLEFCCCCCWYFRLDEWANEKCNRNEINCFIVKWPRNSEMCWIEKVSIVRHTRNSENDDAILLLFTSFTMTYPSACVQFDQITGQMMYEHISIKALSTGQCVGVATEKHLPNQMNKCFSMEFCFSFRVIIHRLMWLFWRLARERFSEAKSYGLYGKIV